MKAPYTTSMLLIVVIATIATIVIAKNESKVAPIQTEPTVWVVGNEYQITWKNDYSPTTSLVLRKIRKDDKLQMIFIASRIENDGEYAFTVPANLHRTQLAGHLFYLQQYPFERNGGREPEVIEIVSADYPN